MAVKYNVDLLKSICSGFNISVQIENYKNVNRNDKIEYSCNACRNNYKKNFRSLYDSSNKCAYCFNKSKYSEWLEKSKKFHEDAYDYSKVIFNNLSTKVIIICKIHGEFPQTPSNHTRFGCSKCGGNYNYTTEEWIEKANGVHGNKYDYSKVEYINTNTKVIIICKVHGEFEQTPGNHLNLEQGCSKCGGTYNYTTDEWIEKAKEVHGNKYDYSKVEYANTKTKITIICKVHGEFEQNPSGHLQGYGCDKCGGTYNYTTEEWIEKAKEVHGNKYDYSKVKYIRSCEEIIIICNACKYEFNQVANAHMQGGGCSKCCGKYSYTTEEWVEKAKEVHENKYDYSKAEYINTNTNVIIICKVHGEFEQTPNCHTSQKQGCSKCGDESSSKKRSYKVEEWIEKAKEVHENKYDYSKVEYDNSKTDVIIICKVHGEFEQNPSGHIQGHGCSKCGDESGSLKRRYKVEEWIEKAKEVHGNNYDYSKVDYDNSKTDVIIKCKVHGEFEQNPSGHLQGYGCSKCGGSYNYKTDEWVEKAKEVHENKYDYSKVEYDNSKTKVIIICKVHGEFEQTPYAHTNQKQGCPCCNIFKSESLCRSILNNLTNSNFIKTRPKFLGGLELDGYCEELKCAFEYNGKQHYYYNKHFHRNGIKDLISQNIRDKIKKQICEENGIKLISIPYNYDHKNVAELEEYIKFRYYK